LGKLFHLVEDGECQGRQLQFMLTTVLRARGRQFPHSGVEIDLAQGHTNDLRASCSGKDKQSYDATEIGAEGKKFRVTCIPEADKFVVTQHTLAIGGVFDSANAHDWIAVDQTFAHAPNIQRVQAPTGFMRAMCSVFALDAGKYGGDIGTSD